MDDKFEQISGIFSQFSEDNKDKLLETAFSLLKVQMEGVVSVLKPNDDVKKLKGRCPEISNNRKG
jgi:hypothetical protein